MDLGDHGRLFLTMMLRMVSNFRMQAVRTTLNGLPAVLRRWAKERIAELQRVAVSVAMNKVARNAARPPRMCRCPRYLPLSWLNGARPANDAISVRLSWPSSGSSATSVALLVGPMPGTDSSNSHLADQSSSDLINLAIALIQGCDLFVEDLDELEDTATSGLSCSL